MGSARAGDEEADGPAGAVLGHVIPKRRFTRWAAWYAFVYLVLPVVALGALVDARVPAPALGSKLVASGQEPAPAHSGAS